MTQKQKQFIIDNYATMDTDLICEHTGLDKLQVKNCASYAGLKKEKTGKKYHLTKKAEIIAKYKDVPTEDLAKEYNTTVEAIRFIAHGAGVQRRKPQRTPTNDDIAKVIQLKSQGLTQIEIQKEVGLRLSYIAAIIEENEEPIPRKDMVISSDGKTFDVDKYLKIFAI